MSQYNLQGSTPVSKRATIAIGQYLCVMDDGTTVGNAVVTSGITSACIGVTMKSGAAGGMVPVQKYGIALCTASAAIAANADVTCDAAGKVTAASGAGATANVIGRTREAAGAAGDIIPVELFLSRPGPVNV